jgi:hypothetical protein
VSQVVKDIVTSFTENGEGASRSQQWIMNNAMKFANTYAGSPAAEPERIPAVLHDLIFFFATGETFDPEKHGER